MKDVMICSCLPVHKEAPVSKILLEESMPQIIEKMREAQKATNLFLVNAHDKASIAVIEKALEENADLKMEMVKTEDSVSYVYTNESAVLSFMDGNNPLPRNREKADLLLQVEDFVDDSIKKVYISGKVSNPGPMDFNRTIKAGELLKACQVEGEFKGMYFDYPMGLFIGPDQLDISLDLTTDQIHIFNEKDCMLQRLKDVAARFQDESCGRCVFGYEGTTQINLILADFINKKGSLHDISRIKALAKQMKVHTVCEIGGVLASAVESALESFEDEIVGHISKKACQAMECSKFLTFHILASKCVGCTECIEACEDEAILGKKKFVHVIDQDECTQCGDCVESCDEGAIVMAGPVKPKCPSKPIPCKKR